MSWAQVSGRIQFLLENGKYAVQDKIDNARNYEFGELSEKLWNIYHDVSEEVKGQFFSSISNRGNNFPEQTKKISELLQQPDNRATIISEATVFVKAFNDNPDVLRFPKFYQPQELLQRLIDLNQPIKTFHADPALNTEHPAFITEDEIDRTFINGNEINESKMRIYSCFLQSHDTNHRISFLRKEYGVGGSYRNGYDISTDSKGYKFTRIDENVKYDSVLLNWSKVESRINKLIKNGKYMSQKELDYIPTYERKQLAEDIFAFYSRQPQDVIRPFPEIKDYYDSYKIIIPLLDDPKQVDKIFNHMLETFATVHPDDRQYSLMQKAIRDMAAFQNGTYSLFNPLSAEPETAQSLKTKRSRTSESQKISDGQLSMIPQRQEYPPEFIPNVEAYLNIKADRADRIIGVCTKDYTLYYGKDAQEAAAVLNTKLLDIEIPGLGLTKITGSKLSWQSNFEKLLEHGHSVAFVREDTEKSKYEIFKERSSDEYIPLGMNLFIDGQSLTINSVDFVAGNVILQDTETSELLHKSVSFVRHCIEEEEKERIKQPQPAKPQPETDYTNYSISENQTIAGGQKTKYKNNVEAIRLLKRLESENRRALPEEQKILARYVGWGGIPQAFDANNQNWAKEYAELKELLTEKEYASANSSVLTAYYTDPEIIKAIYHAVENMKIPVTNILEPAMGIGNFFGVIPDSMKKAKLYGVELDGISGSIAKQLYPKADITIDGFEKTTFPDSSFDLAIGNIPFGDYKVPDKLYNKYNLHIHDYFFIKTLDKIRPGGILAFITSKGTLDKQNPAVRQLIAQKADLLGAIRLPNNAFKANAGTEVPADIIFLQKRTNAPIQEPEWTRIGMTADGIPLNRYFLQNPSMVLGEMVFSEKMFGNKNSTTCIPIQGVVLSEQLPKPLRILPHLIPGFMKQQS